MAHEIVHNLHKSKEKGVVLKLDYENAYDRVSWTFLFDMLETRNFAQELISWIRQIVVGGSIGILLNGEDSSYFKTGNGLRQGDPLSPFLFNLVGDVLTKMLQKGAEGDHQR